MSDEKTTQYHRYYLKSLRPEIPPIIFHREILTLGRSETCDVQIDNAFLSHVHASIFFNNGDFFLTDLNSTNGTFVNDQPVKVRKLEIGDVIRFGSVRYQLMPLTEAVGEKGEKTLETVYPLQNENVMDKLSESAAPPAFKFSHEQRNALAGQTALPAATPGANFNFMMSTVKPVTPLDLVPALNYSEFIFEENAEGQAMDFSHTQPSLEITVFINEYVVSVEYFLASQHELIATGAYGEKALNLPFLDTNEKIPFLNYKNNSFGVYDYTEEQGWLFQIYSPEGALQKYKIEDGFIKLKKDYIVTLMKDDFQVIIKQVDSPPKTLPVPFVVFDSLLNKVFFSLIPIYLAIIVSMILIPSHEKDFDEQKIEIDRIIYVKEVPPPRVILPPKKESAETAGDANTKEGRGEIVKAQKIDIPKNDKPKENTAVSLPTIVNQQLKKPVLPPSQPPANAVSTKPVTSQNITKDVSLTNPNATEAIPPRLDMKSLQSRLGKKLESTGVGSNVITDKGVDGAEGPRSVVGANSGAEVKDVGPIQSNVTGAVNVPGAVTGDLGKGKSITSSLGGGVGIFDGVDGRKVVLGIMDPNEVQNILRRYIPQFQFCYEKELERTNSKIATTLVLEFTINPEGRPENGKFDSKNLNFTDSANSCFKQVLYSIQFSKPKGGGTVGIRQPLNMEPRY